jgi:two-component system response regulator RegA
MNSSADDGPVRETLLMETNDDLGEVQQARTTVSALVVDPTLSDALSVASALTKFQFQITLAETFVKGKERLGTRPPDVLITDIRLGEYNGLHLVLRASTQRPGIAAIVLSSTLDEVLRADAESMGATFMLKPVSERDLTAAIFRTIARQKTPGRAAEPIRPPFERRATERRGDVAPTTVDRRLHDRRRNLDALLYLAGSPAESAD